MKNAEGPVQSTEHQSHRQATLKPPRGYLVANR